MVWTLQAQVHRSLEVQRDGRSHHGTVRKVLGQWETKMSFYHYLLETLLLETFAFCSCIVWSCIGWVWIHAMAFSHAVCLAPTRRAVALLRESQGLIALALPVHGDTQTPASRYRPAPLAASSACGCDHGSTRSSTTSLRLHTRSGNPAAKTAESLSMHETAHNIRKCDVCRSVGVRVSQVDVPVEWLAHTIPDGRRLIGGGSSHRRR